MVSVYESKTYRSFIEKWISTQPRKGYGLKSQLAQVIGTHTGFVTQVFNEMAHFSLEQGLEISKWMGLNEDENEYFLLLIQKDRAGNSELKKHFETKMERIKERREALSEKLKVKKAPSQIDQSVYFSSWIYSLIHVLLTCKEVTSFEEIVQTTGFKPTEVKKVLDFLVEAQVAEETKKGYKTGDVRMHLGTNSPNLLKHHLNWNLRAIQSIEKDLKEGMHYTSVISLSKEDYEKAMELWTKTVSEFKELVRKSKGEAVYGFTLNLFEAT